MEFFPAYVSTLVFLVFLVSAGQCPDSVSVKRQKGERPLGFNVRASPEVLQYLTTNANSNAVRDFEFSGKLESICPNASRSPLSGGLNFWSRDDVCT
jgi:hypothetical protein